MSFRREAHVPRGGPDGGDGGRGGDVRASCATSRCATCRASGAGRHYRAGRGGHGAGALRHGADGETLSSGCRPGRRSRRASSARRRRSLTEAEHGGESRPRTCRPRWELLRPGRAPRSRAAGAAARATSASRRPRARRRASPSAGSPGEEGWLELRLKLLADVGLVGLPNAGKSSLLARLTRAAPKVADYPVHDALAGARRARRRRAPAGRRRHPRSDRGRERGRRAGHDFLAHVERTRLLVHVLDIAPELSMGEDADAAQQLRDDRARAGRHDERLARAAARARPVQGRPARAPSRLETAVAEWQRRLGAEVPVIATSSATGAGVRELARAAAVRTVPDAPSHGA